MKHLKRFNESKTYDDFVIFKIRYYGDNDQQHWQRAQEYNKFFWDMVFKITGFSSNYWVDEYGLGAQDCVKEELYEMFGILIPNSEEYEFIYVPKKLSGLIEWIKKNCKLPYTIATEKTDTLTPWLDRPVSYDNRDRSKRLKRGF